MAGVHSQYGPHRQLVAVSQVIFVQFLSDNKSDDGVTSGCYTLMLYMQGMLLVLCMWREQ